MNTHTFMSQISQTIWFYCVSVIETEICRDSRSHSTAVHFSPNLLWQQLFFLSLMQLKNYTHTHSHTPCWLINIINAQGTDLFMQDQCAHTPGTSALSHSLSFTHRHRHTHCFWYFMRAWHRHNTYPSSKLSGFHKEDQALLGVESFCIAGPTDLNFVIFFICAQVNLSDL